MEEQNTNLHDNIPSPALQQMIEDNLTRNVQIFVVNDEESQACDYWIGLFTKGPHSPNHLFYKSSLLEVFETAAKEGLEEAVPIMLSDTTAERSKYLYLSPELENDEHKTQDWIRHTIQAVVACKPATVGIYLSPTAMQDKSCSEDFLEKLVEALLRETTVATIALFPGDYGTNAVLNTALRIKNTFVGDQKLHILVYH